MKKNRWELNAETKEKVKTLVLTYIACIKTLSFFDGTFASNQDEDKLTLDLRRPSGNSRLLVSEMKAAQITLAVFFKKIIFFGLKNKNDA